MAEDLMRYDVLAQQALRGVVRAAMKQVERSGLPGEHHFYIAFDTNYPGVKLSDRLKRKYPEEMTVVLQHQFWGLVVSDDGFKVELSFDNIPEKMEIPFASVKGFFDPHVQFGLQFEMEEANQNGESAAKETDSAPAKKKPKATASEAEPDGESDEDGTTATPVAANDEGPEDETGDSGSDDIAEEESAEKVISLDAFRKK